MKKFVFHEELAGFNRESSFFVIGCGRNRFEKIKCPFCELLEGLSELFWFLTELFNLLKFAINDADLNHSCNQEALFENGTKSFPLFYRE